MGFYLELSPLGEKEFQEQHVPPVYWGLFLFAGFALACMGLAAHALLGDLARIGSAWDKAIVGGIVACVPIYVAIGFKLLALRKYVLFSPSGIETGFRLGEKRVWKGRFPKEAISAVELVNQRPASNVAPKIHEDRQYYIQGHWRLVLRLKDGRSRTLDKHVERGALLPLLEGIQKTLSLGSGSTPAAH